MPLEAAASPPLTRLLGGEGGEIHEWPSLGLLLGTPVCPPTAFIPRVLVIIIVIVTAGVGSVDVGLAHGHPRRGGRAVLFRMVGPH